MTLKTFSIIITFSCLLIQVFSHSVFINNKENKDVYNVHIGKRDNYFEVSLFDNENNNGYWYLQNTQELYNYDIYPMYIENENGDMISGIYVYNYNGGYVYYDFYKGHQNVNRYPKLKFYYYNESDEYNEAVVTVNIDIDPEIHFDDIVELNKSLDYQMNTVDVTINHKEDFMLYLTNDFFTGFNWYLENESEIDENPYIELVSSYSRPGSYEFAFRAKKLPSNQFLPTLIFSEKNHKKSEMETANRIYKVNLNIKEDYFIGFERDDQEELKASAFIYNEEYFVVALNVTSKDNKWFLEKEELDSGIEPVILGEDGEGEFFVWDDDDDEVDVVGTYKFKFQLKKSVPPGYNTTLKFVEAQSRNDDDDIVSTAEVSIKTKKERTEEEINHLPTKEVHLNYKTEIEVESNMILVLTTSHIPSNGNLEEIINLDEIERSGLIDFIGKTCYSKCSLFEVECGGWCDNKFRIWEVSEDDVLPQIKLSYPFFRYSDHSVTLIPKSSNSDVIECLEGYKCCSETTTEVSFVDMDGYWGFEDDEWCILNKKKREVKQIRNCVCFNDEYPCCNESTLVTYTDMDGYWGVNNDEWCSIPAYCDYELYPVCQETTEVVYTDTEEWGVEYDQWCIM